MNKLRWRIFKLICFVGWKICPKKEREDFNWIYQTGLNEFADRKSHKID